MEYFAETACRLCLNGLSCENFKVIDETILHVLNLSMEEDCKPLVCTSCSMKLFEAYQFKSTCMDTEDNISSHVDSENVTPADLREVYLKINGTEYLGTIMEDERICRLCMHIVTSGFVSVDDVETDVIQTFIPEINFSFTKEPIICAACLDSLNTHNSFLKSCLEMKGQIKSIHNNEETPFGIKVEDIEIKSEENEDSDEHNGVGNMSEDNNNSLDVPLFKCHMCDFRSKYKGSVLRHQVRHEDVSEVQLYKCYACDFKTAYKNSLSNHQMIHKDSSEIEIYKCGTCDYETKYKRALSRHELTHKDSSEVEMYKCDACDYKTKYKDGLKKHQRRCKNLSEKQLYECGEHDFRTKQMYNLVSDQLQHKNISKVQVYECGTCDFKTKLKRSLITHQLKHKTPSEVKMYSCSKCDYKTKYKYHLPKHQLMHKDSSEVQFYNCCTCDYKTKHKYNLTKHQLKHKDFSEIQIYKCSTCNFKTIYKRGLSRHELAHKDSSVEVEMYKSCQ